MKPDYPDVKINIPSRDEMLNLFETIRSRLQENE